MEIWRSRPFRSEHGEDEMTTKIHSYFNRYEFKFIIDLETRDRIIKDITPFCKVDENSPSKKDYSVVSVYYDSDSFRSYFEKIDGEKMRRKVRIRIYPDSKTDKCFIEIKSKINTNVYKKRVYLKLDDAKKLLAKADDSSRIYRLLNETDRKVIDEVWIMKHRRKLKPKSVVSYKRMAFEGRYDRRFRLTFDNALKVRKTDLEDFKNQGGIYALSPKSVIMEVKFNQIIPVWMINILNRYDLISIKISKYCSGIEQLYQLGGI